MKSSQILEMKALLIYLGSLYCVCISLHTVAACVDKNSRCGHWASTGECPFNPCYMLNFCQKSCNDCNKEFSRGSGECTNKRDDCYCLAAQGKCTDAAIKADCTKSCERKCGARLPTDCYDLVPNCVGWAAAGECTKNPAYMKTRCKYSCKNCPDCKDNNAKCAHWASMGECLFNPCYMLKQCRYSCKDCVQELSLGTGDCSNTREDCPCLAAQGKCTDAAISKACKKSCDHACGAKLPTDCYDLVSQCTGWAASGECDKNPAYMHTRCKKSCNKC